MKQSFFFRISFLLISALTITVQSTEAQEDKSPPVDFAGSINATPVDRPTSVADRFKSNVVDYMWDGIPASRLDLEHPSILMQNGISEDWQLSPSNTGVSSISFVNRMFQSASFSISIFKKGVYLKDTKPNSMKAVAASLISKHSSKITFESWQTDEFKDPEMPRTMENFEAKAIGYTLIDPNNKERSHRLYFFELGDWIFEVAFQCDATAYDATFEAFDTYIYNLIIKER